MTGRLSSLILLLAGGSFFLGFPTMHAERSRQIVVLGDSLTAGYGLNPSRSFPSLLQQKIDEAALPWTVLNAGMNGDTTAGGWNRVAANVTPGTDVLIIALGGNDGLRRLPPEQMQRNLRGIVLAAKKISPRVAVLMAGIRPPAEWAGPAYRQAYLRAYEEAARTSGAVFLPDLLDKVGGIAAMNQADGIHPTAAGQREIAATVWRILRPMLQPPRE